MTINLGMRGYADHLAPVSNLRREEVSMLARNHAVLYLCVCENKPQKVITEMAV